MRRPRPTTQATFRNLNIVSARGLHVGRPGTASPRRIGTALVHVHFFNAKVLINAADARLPLCTPPFMNPRKSTLVCSPAKLQAAAKSGFGSHLQQRRVLSDRLSLSQSVHGPKRRSAVARGDNRRKSDEGRSVALHLATL